MLDREIAELTHGFSEEILTRQQRCCFAVDDDGILRHLTGKISHYGLPKLEIGKQVLDSLEFLHGLAPLEGSEYLHLPAIKVGECNQCSLHLFRRENLTWVVLLDPTSGNEDSIHQLQLNPNKGSAVSLDKVFGQEIAERMSKGFESVNQQGERREVSVLFADLRGFTAFCDSNDTVDIFPLLNQFLGGLIKPVIDNNGIVDKIIGDAVMAVFGLGSDEGADYKARAIKTGKEMILRMSDLTGSSVDSTSVLGVGVGVASGDVVVGSLGTDRRRSFTVIGHRVNLAARLESQARPGELLIDVATWEGLTDGQDQFELTDLWLKGLSRPVPAMSLFP